MKNIFVFLGLSFLVIGFPQIGQAQLFDDLFDDEDFTEKTEPSPAASVSVPPASTLTPVRASPAQSAPRSAPAPISSARPISPAPAVSSVSASNIAPVPSSPPATFSLPAPSSSEGLLSSRPSNVPQLGSSSQMPTLGKKSSSSSSRKEETDKEGLSLFEMRAKRTGTKTDSNISNFDIAGIQLRMIPDEVLEIAQENGFSLKFINHSVPDLNKWRYHQSCLQGLFSGYSGLQDCIKEKSKETNSRYVNRMVFEKKKAKEFLTVEFTSNASENHAFRIYYENKGNHSLGTTSEAHYLKTKRRQDFLRTLLRKYGRPDDDNSLVWGVAGFGAVMSADISDSFQDVTILLEDITLEDVDFDNISAEDAREQPATSFGF